MADGLAKDVFREPRSLMSIGIWAQAAISRLAPLLAAEAARGNVGVLVEGDGRETRAAYRMKHPLDLESLRQEFRFGPGITLYETSDGGAIEFESGIQADAAFVIRGGSSAGWSWRRRRDRWRRDWAMAPREQVLLENPFRGEGL
jgi:hypothetical protein